MTRTEHVPGDALAKPPEPEPIRRRGEPFFDQLVEGLYTPALVRRVMYTLLQEQHKEAGRISTLRSWGGAQPFGNDRYQYSLEQGKRLAQLLPGAELLRPNQSLMYRIAGALVYPMRFGSSAKDCPFGTKIDVSSEMRARLATGSYHFEPTLFDPDPEHPPAIVWLLYTGNHVEGGPLSSYLAIPGPRLPDGRIDWKLLEPLLNQADCPKGAGQARDFPPRPMSLPLSPPPVPKLGLRLKP